MGSNIIQRIELMSTTEYESEDRSIHGAKLLEGLSNDELTMLRRKLLNNCLPASDNLETALGAER